MKMYVMFLVSVLLYGVSGMAGDSPKSQYLELPLERYICYDDYSKISGVWISVNHVDLIVYAVGVRSQHGGMYSDSDGRQSIIDFRDEQRGANGFDLNNGKVVSDSSGHYSDTLGYENLRFILGNGKHINNVTGRKADGSEKTYVGCESVSI